AHGRAKPVYYLGEKGWPQRRGAAWASGACWKSEPMTDGIRAVPALFHSVLHSHGGRWWHPVQRAHRVAGGRESGNSGEWPCTRAYTELGGGGCHAPRERGILRRTVAGGWIRRLIEWLHKGCGIGTS
ncbi:hypothetical protein HAX54_008355, partial [Datura stramonium]|nr:hypothetical protein [Datura stramonium]